MKHNAFFILSGGTVQSAYDTTDFDIAEKQQKKRRLFRHLQEDADGGGKE